MKNKLILIAITLMMVSCDKREFYTPTTEDGQTIEHPGQVIATVTSDAVENTKVFFYAPGKPEVNAITGVPVDIEAGNYQVVIVSNYEDIEMNGSTVTLPTSEDGETVQAPPFYAGVGNVTIKEGEVTRLSIPLHPMTREVQFRFSISGIQTDEIQKIEVLLYGVRIKCNLSEGFTESIARSRAISSYYIRSIPEEKENTYYSNIRLLGIDPEKKQEVAIHITGHSGLTYIYSQDVSEQLAEFNQGYADVTLVMNTQIILDLNDITGSIKPWVPGNEEDIPMK